MELRAAGPAQSSGSAPTWRAARTVSRCLRSASRMLAAICRESSTVMIRRWWQRGQQGRGCPTALLTPKPAGCAPPLAPRSCPEPLRAPPPSARGPPPTAPGAPAAPPPPGSPAGTALSPDGARGCGAAISGAARSTPPLPSQHRSRPHSQSLPGEVLQEPGLRHRQPPSPPVPGHGVAAAGTPNLPLVLRRLLPHHDRVPQHLQRRRHLRDGNTVRRAPRGGPGGSRTHPSPAPTSSCSFSSASRSRRRCPVL